MANQFLPIEQFTPKSTLTGTEEIQVSATEKVTTQQIADLATRGLSIITVTNFNTRTWTGGKSASEMVEGEIQAFISAANTTGAPSNSAYRGFVQKVSGNSTSYILRYYAWSADVSVTGIYIGFSMCVGNCSWKSLTFDQSRETVIEVGDFTTINELWPASVEQTPGNVVSFYTGAEVYSQPEASETKYVGFVILDTDFANTKTATVIAYGQNIGKQYIGKLEYEAQSIDWYPLTYASRLTNAVKVTAFTESSLSSLLSSWKAGDVVPFTTDSVIASTANQFPESGIFNGFVSMGRNEGDYFQIFAFKTGSPNAYIGACIGSTTRWTQIGGSSIVQITEYGGLYDASELVNAPTGSITAFHAEGQSVDDDLGPFGGRATAVSGIYIATEGSDYLETRSGIIIAYRADGEKGMAYAYCYGTKSGGGGIHNTDDWMVVENGESSGGVEKLSTWLEQGTEVAPHINIGLGEVRVPLNRALKESDILRIDFMRRSEASTFYMQGVAIIHVGAVDNSIQGYAAALDEQYVDYGTGEFAALALDANTKLIDHNYFNLYIDTNGSVPQDDYYIMGVYNISGK